MVCKSFTLELDFNIKPVFVAANPLVSADNGKIALTYGPLVYCVEGADNGERLGRLSVSPVAAEGATLEKDFHGFYSITVDGLKDKAQKALYFTADKSGYESVRIKFIPYFAFANRGSSDMLVWIRKA